jgi:hypothetical protein
MARHSLRELLRDRLRENISLAERSAVAGVSTGSVIKAFRRFEGSTPGE